MLHGLLLIDKPSGITSHDVVARVRKSLQMKSVGHAGTLDPLATGLMVILVGEATKLSDYLLNGDKSYLVTAKLGFESDTLDTDSELRATNVSIPSGDEIKATAKSMEGELELPVPAYSAVKVKGKKLVDEARKNKEIETPVRTMEFMDVDVVEIGEKEACVEIQCQKGAYIRAWVKELGQRLGCGGVVSELRRLFSAPYYIDQAMELEKLEDFVNEKRSKNEGLLGEADFTQIESFVPINNCLKDWKALTAVGRDEKLMSNGQIPNEMARRMLPEQKLANQLERTLGMRIMRGSTGDLLSLVEVQPFKGPKIRRIFNLHRNP